MTDTLLVDLVESARQLGSVSTRTVRRLIDAESLRTVRVGSRLMVTMESLLAYVDRGNSDSDNPARVGPDVRETDTCRNASKTKTGFTSGATPSAGGCRIQTPAASALDALLERPSEKKPRRSSRNGGLRPTGSASGASSRRGPSRT